jgi:hypothetical protein
MPSTNCGPIGFKWVAFDGAKHCGGDQRCFAKPLPTSTDPSDLSKGWKRLR